MNFLLKNKRKYFVVFCVFFSLAIYGYAQITIPPNTVGASNNTAQNGEESVVQTPLQEQQPNEYADIYKEVPRLPAKTVRWYSAPKKIASRVQLGEIGARIERFPDDTPYVEKTQNGIKSRLFLKETTGLLFRIYDMKFVPYIITKDATSGNAKETITIPTQKERDTGTSLFVEITTFRTDNQIKALVRYNGTEKLFEESYKYTSKGALRSLVRNYTDDSLFRFLYYFNSGGLEEELYQDADGSYYYKKYTLAGDLQERAEYASDGTVINKLVYAFDVTGEVTSKTETDTRKKVVSEYKDGRIYTKVTYDISGNTEKIVTTVHYGYSEDGATASDRSVGLLNENSSQSFFDKDGNLIQRKEFVNSELIKEIEYKNNNTRIETQYFKNKPVLRVYYSGLRKEKEEVIQN